MMEIGSEFWLRADTVKAGGWQDPHFVLSGRTAIDRILQDILARRKLRSVYMPAYSCASMSDPFIRRGISPVYYEVYPAASWTYEIDPERNVDILYVNNYFGYDTTLDTRVIRRFKDRGTIILYDRTHSWLREEDPVLDLADYVFVSLRKWTALVTGAWVSVAGDGRSLKDCPYWEEKAWAMDAKRRYLEGDSSVVKPEFLSAFSAFNTHLSADYQDYAIDPLSYVLWQQTDSAAIRSRRRANAAILHETLASRLNLLPLRPSDCPLFVPVFFDSAEERDAMRRHLTAQQIYCPVHWPKPASVPERMAVTAFKGELSLICDQRYGPEDMYRIAETIKNK